MHLAKGLDKIHCKFAIDNFGTGLKPFQLMKAMPVEYLRIDRSLMQGINTNKENQETIRTINDTARSDGHKTIAPFVEDATALSILWGIGVNYIQGNFLREARETMDYDFSDMM
jgi:EAL domain-containing protein (putative c-di-GMP-specific phosphodiesterase class I)